MPSLHEAHPPLPLLRGLRTRMGGGIPQGCQGGGASSTNAPQWSLSLSGALPISEEEALLCVSVCVCPRYLPQGQRWDCPVLHALCRRRHPYSSLFRLTPKKQLQS